MKLVSIVTATYNSASYISDLYESLNKQSYINWEWLVTDDKSEDNTLNLLRDIEAKDPRVTVFQNKENLGAGLSRNNSMRNSSGDYVAFVDSDDVWAAEKLEKQIKYMERCGYNFTFTAYEMINEAGIKLGKTVDLTVEGAVNYTDMLKKKATLGCSTVVISRALCSGRSMLSIRTGQDYVFWLEILRSGVLAYPIKEVLTFYRITPNSISRNKFKKAIRQWAIYRNIEKISFNKSLYYFIFYAFRALFRRK